jgi:hypothetical protein
MNSTWQVTVARHFPHQMRPQELDLASALGHRGVCTQMHQTSLAVVWAGIQQVTCSVGSETYIGVRGLLAC